MVVTKEQRHIQTKRESNVLLKTKRKRSRNLINNKPKMGSNELLNPALYNNPRIKKGYRFETWFKRAGKNKAAAGAKKKGGECRFSLLLERESLERSGKEIFCFFFFTKTLKFAGGIYWKSRVLGKERWERRRREKEGDGGLWYL